MAASRIEHRLVPIADDEDAPATARALEASDRTDGDIAVLAGEGPHAPVATRRTAELVATQVDGTVVIERGPEESPMSIREAISRRLEV